MNRSGRESTHQETNPGSANDQGSVREQNASELAPASTVYDSVQSLQKGQTLSGVRPAEVLNLQRTLGNRAVQRLIERTRQAKSSQAETVVQRKGEEGEATGLPAPLKSKIESLSGIAMDDVRVHYNSDKPAQLNANAYAQGSDIFVGPGQEEHLPHEAWHVVQQKQGRVKPTTQL